MSYSSTLAGGENFRLFAENLVIGRNGRMLAAGLSFALAAGEALVVTGPNGAGKSTLLRTLAGLLPALEGGVAVSGEGIEDGETAGACAHYLGHADAMKSALTVRENLEFWASMLGSGQGMSEGSSVEKALAAVELPHVIDFPFGYLSAGQKRRIGLAKLLVAHRPLWLLDEPTTALDSAAQQRLAGIMRAHLSGGGVVIAATHSPLGLEDARELRIEPRKARGAAA
jgi:heme exporter protein A